MEFGQDCRAVIYLTAIGEGIWSYRIKTNVSIENSFINYKFRVFKYLSQLSLYNICWLVMAMFSHSSVTSKHLKWFIKNLFVSDDYVGTILFFFLFFFCLFVYYRQLFDWATNVPSWKTAASWLIRNATPTRAASAPVLPNTPSKAGLYADKVIDHYIILCNNHHIHVCV